MIFSRLREATSLLMLLSPQIFTVKRASMSDKLNKSKLIYSPNLCSVSFMKDLIRSWNSSFSKDTRNWLSKQWTVPMTTHSLVPQAIKSFRSKRREEGRFQWPKETKLVSVWLKVLLYWTHWTDSHVGIRAKQLSPRLFNSLKILMKKKNHGCHANLTNQALGFVRARLGRIFGQM